MFESVRSSGEECRGVYCRGLKKENGIFGGLL